MKRLFIIALLVLFIGCTKQQFREIFIDWPKVDNPTNDMVEYYKISRLTGESISFREKPSLNRVLFILGKQPYIIAKKEEKEYVAVWKTDHRNEKYRYFVGLFNDGALFGIDYGVDQYPEIKKMITMDMLNKCWNSDGLEQLKYKHQIGGGDI